MKLNNDTYAPKIRSRGLFDSDESEFSPEASMQDLVLAWAKHLQTHGDLPCKLLGKASTENNDVKPIFIVTKWRIPSHSDVPFMLLDACLSAKPTDQSRDVVWFSRHAENSVATVTLKSRQDYASDIALEFNRLADEWEREASVYSLSRQQIKHPAFSRIIALGPGVIHLAIERLKYSIIWDLVLYRLVDNPPEFSESGRVEDIRKAWQHWAERPENQVSRYHI